MSARDHNTRPSPEDAELVSAAQIVKSYNTNGDVVIRLTSGLLEDYDHREPVFLYFEGLPVPFFIESYRPKGNNGALVKFTSINDLPHSEELIKKEIFIDPRYLTAEAALNNPDSSEEFLIGSVLQDENEKEIGTVADFLDFPGNPCLKIRRKNGNTDFLVPFNEELVLRFDPRKKILQMHIPVGLQDL